MAETPMEDEREKFEAWARPTFNTDTVPDAWDQPTYKEPLVDAMWFGWQARASEVEAARASLPAPTDAEELREWERIAVERATDFGAALYVKVAQVMPEERVRLARAALLAHLRARPAEPTPSAEWQRLYTAVNELMAFMGAHGKAFATGNCARAVMEALHAIDGGTVQPTPSVDVLRQCLEALQGVIAWDTDRNYLVPYKVRDPVHAAIKAAQQALEKP